jgi:EmrB/QacA subfamily drug resistance transporter
MLELIVFRGLQGLGGGGIMAMAQVIIGDIVAPRERGRYQGYTGTVFAFSSVLGPLIGGLFTDQVSWRWVFYINIPIGALALVVTSLYLRLPVRRQEHRIDYLGAALLMACVTCLLLVTTWGGIQYAWTSPTIVAMAIAGVALLVAFVYVEGKAPEPILPLHLLKRRIFAVCSSVSFIAGVAMFGAISFMPLYLQIVQGASATASGLRLTPMMLGLLATSIGSGQLISRTGRYRIYPLVGTAVMGTGLLMLSTLDAGSSVLLASVYMAILGAGIGLVMQVMILAVQNDAPAAEMGAATASVSFFRSMGAAAGVALFGSLLTTRLDANLARLPAGALQGVNSSALTGSPDAVAALPPEVHQFVTHAFADSLGLVFLAAVPIVLVAFALCWLLREIPLRETAHFRVDSEV